MKVDRCGSCLAVNMAELVCDVIFWGGGGAKTKSEKFCNLTFRTVIVAALKLGYQVNLRNGDYDKL